MQTTAYAEGFLRLTDANPFSFFQRKQTSDKKALNILKKPHQKGNFLETKP